MAFFLIIKYEIRVYFKSNNYVSYLWNYIVAFSNKSINLLQYEKQ